jgi:hypothetical protein
MSPLLRTPRTPNRGLSRFIKQSLEGDFSEVAFSEAPSPHSPDFMR